MRCIQAYIRKRSTAISLAPISDRAKTIPSRKEAEQRLHDPVIKENLENLSEESKEQFLEYLDRNNVI